MIDSINIEAFCYPTESLEKVKKSLETITELKPVVTTVESHLGADIKILTVKITKQNEIKEIIGMMPITTVPQTPEFVKGVINLRGKVIPVIDLRLRFGMDSIDYTERTCIIVVEIEKESGTVMIGIVVDSVSVVLNIKAEDIEDTPTFGTKLDSNYILCMAKMEGGVKIVLDIDQVLSAEEVADLKKAA